MTGCHFTEGSLNHVIDYLILHIRQSAQYIIALQFLSGVSIRPRATHQTESRLYFDAIARFRGVVDATRDTQRAVQRAGGFGRGKS